MRFKKALCMTTLATLLFPVVQNIEYVDAAEYSVDIIVDTVEIDINNIPEDRCVKVGISLRNNPGMDGIFFPLEKDSRLEFFGNPPLDYPNMFLSISNLTEDISGFSLFYGNIDGNLICGDDYFCYVKFLLPEDVLVNNFYVVNILEKYTHNSNENSDGALFNLRFNDKDLKYCASDCFNITNGGIRIVGTEPSQIEPLQTEPPQTEPPQTEPLQTEPLQTEPPQTEHPQTSTSQTISTTIESTTNTTTSITTTTNESTVATTENTTISTTSVTTTSSVSSITTTTTTTEISEITENKNDKSQKNLPLILAILASVGILGRIIGFIIKKSKGHREK